MQTPNRQSGITLIGWLVILVLIGFFSMLVIKLGPLYLENYTVREAVQSLANEPGMASNSSHEIKRLLFNRLDINYVENLPRDKVKVKKAGGTVNIDITYEVRRNIIGNVDAVVSFSEKAELVVH